MSEIVNSLRKRYEIDWRQQDCIERSRISKSKSMRVFAFEDPSFKPGCRKYVAAEIKDFYSWYKECPELDKHFYELILENVPCRLYFDLELLYEFNEGVNATAMLDDFIQVTCSSIYDLLDIKLCPKRDFLILESSNSAKFSVHIIVHIPAQNPSAEMHEFSRVEPQMIFSDNTSIKPLVTYICGKLLNSDKCLIKRSAEEGNMTCLCDTSVYSRNRNFRMYKSSKCRKAEKFKLADCCPFYSLRKVEAPKDVRIFLDSFVIPFDYDTMPIINLDTVAELKPENLKILLKNGLDFQRKKHGNRLITFPYLLNAAELEYHEKKNQQTETNNSIITVTKSNTINSPNIKLTTTVVELAGGLRSPLPDLDHFMLKIFRKFNPNAMIRVFKLIKFKQASNKKSFFHLQYQLTNSRYCMNRGREHKNQNVYWVVDLSTFHFVQRCFDKADCPNYISPAFAFPDEICEYIHQKIGSVLKMFKVSEEEYDLPTLESLRLKTFRIESDSRDKTVQWKDNNGATKFLNLYTPVEAFEPEEENDDDIIVLD